MVCLYSGSWLQSRLSNQLSLTGRDARLPN
nr:MAG TPA: hypothetical protein [Caudoviricetes sp.]DAL85658.1 MAG TPA: hypothetical protein [Bacteriophage sp.]DAM43216.1 MAG TPA: hypothetical protein [Caudoviricetes sp.]